MVFNALAWTRLSLSGRVRPTKGSETRSFRPVAGVTRTNLDGMLFDVSTPITSKHHPAPSFKDIPTSTNCNYKPLNPLNPGAQAVAYVERQHSCCQLSEHWTSQRTSSHLSVE